MLLEAQVFEKDLPQVRDAKKASYTSPSLPSEVYRIGEGGDGQLLMIGQTVNSETRAVPVIYEVINPLGKLRDGMSVEITIDTNADGKILSVPKTAVIEEQGQFFVFVQKDAETFSPRRARSGA